MCQARDWKLKGGAHKKWCGATGEIGHDVAVRRVKGKGMGLFALRRFARNEKIMVEHAAITTAQLRSGIAAAVQGMPAGMQRAAGALVPHTSTMTRMATWTDDTWAAKFKRTYPLC